MNVLPVIAREMRVQARLAATFGVRVAGVAILLLVACHFGMTRGFDGSPGGALFSRLNLALFCAIWILAPLLAADCISREKREGTLGLLFLTPLRAGEIVLAKGLVHGLRALTLWLAVLPILIVPMLLGGVGWREAVLSLLINFSSLALALAAGLLSSALGKAWSRSVLLAALASLLSLAVFLYVLGLGLVIFLTWKVPGGTMSKLISFGWSAFDRILGVGFFGATDFDQSWQSLLGILPAGRQRELLGFLGSVAASAFMVLLAVVPLAAWIMKRGWQESPPSAWQRRCAQLFLTPVVGVSLLKRWQQRSLSRNPIGWLELRTWSGRLATWGWFAAAIVLSVVMLGEGRLRFGGELQWAFGLALCSLGASAAGSFRRERETGVLELLLVAPGSESRIIQGRLIGIWSQFLPALAWLAGVMIFFTSIFQLEDITGALWLFGANFVTLPIVGLYFSLHRNNFMSAFLMTMLLGVGVPLVLPPLLVLGFAWGPGQLLAGVLGGRWNAEAQRTVEITGVAIELMIGALIFRRLRADLVNRNFAFDRSVA